MPKHRFSTVVVLFTRDLRVHDHAGLTAAVESAEQVLPLFVLDDRVLDSFGAPNRLAFLLESLQDLRRLAPAGADQWVAGTGADSRPYRMLNPYRQADRFDQQGIYVRRYLPELGTPDYPGPIVEHEDAVARFRRAAA